MIEILQWASGVAVAAWAIGLITVLLVAAGELEL